MRVERFDHVALIRRGFVVVALAAAIAGGMFLPLLALLVIEVAGLQYCFLRSHPDARWVGMFDPFNYFVLSVVAWTTVMFVRPLELNKFVGAVIDMIGSFVSVM